MEPAPRSAARELVRAPDRWRSHGSIERRELFRGMSDEPRDSAAAAVVLPAPRRRSGCFVIVAGFWVVFASLAPGFLSPFNLFSLGRTLAVDIVIGFAQMVVLATGGMNLAVGAIGVCAVMAADS